MRGVSALRSVAGGLAFAAPTVVYLLFFSAISASGLWPFLSHGIPRFCDAPNFGWWHHANKGYPLGEWVGEKKEEEHG